MVSMSFPLPSRWQHRVSKLPALERIVKECFTELSSNVPSFLDHTYLLNGNIFLFLQKMYANTHDGEITLHIAFSENEAPML